MGRESIGSCLWLAGWVAAFSIGSVLGPLVPWWFALEQPWRQLVGMACFGLPVLAYAGVSSWLQPRKQGWLVMDAYYQDQSLQKSRRGVVVRQATIFALAITSACLIGWCILWAMFGERSVNGHPLAQSVSGVLQLSLPIGLATWVFGYLLYASRVRSTNPPRESPEPRNDA